MGTSESETRVCARCGVAKSLEEFHIRYRETGERLTCCRTCMAEYKHAWYLRNSEHQKGKVRENIDRTTREHQARAWTYLGDHPCVDCGEADPVVLHFDHLANKTHNVSYMLGQGFAWPVIEREIAKCEVRCGNCHRRKTARQQGFYDRKHAFMKQVGPAAPAIRSIIDAGR